MLKTSLVVIVIVLLVAAGLWLNMDSEPDVVAVEPDIVNVMADEFGADDVNFAPVNEPMQAAGMVPSAPAEIEFGELLVVVQDVAAFPLSDVRITLRSGNDVDDLRRSVTDSTGEAAFGPIPTGSYNYDVEAPNRPLLTSARPIVLSAGEYRVLELQLDDHAQSIQGRVIDTNGVPVADIEITAQAYRAGDRPRLTRAESNVVTDANGAFEVAGLASGEYRIQTRETERYTSSKAIVRAGTLSAMLMVAEQRTVKISGKVKDEQGFPLAGVRVMPLGQSGADTNTDPTGHYEVTLEIDDTQRRYHLRFRDAGYREALISVAQEDWTNTDVIVLDVALEPLGDTVAVSGSLLDAQGRPIAGEQLHLFSPGENVHYRARSDQLGSFIFREAVTGDDYRLWVRPKENYNDYTREPIRIADVPMQLDIVLDLLETGTVTGRVTDRQGSPVPHLKLLLYSTRASSRPIDVSSDANGTFIAQEVPAGMLTFRTRSSPRLHVENVELSGGEVKHVEIVLDQGWETFRGALADATGHPIGGAQVYLYDNSETAGGRTQHSTVTDAYGSFTFEALGSGPYRLDITAPGFLRFTQSLEPRQDFLEVRLEPSAN